ncbi:CdaR family protein [Treponema pectinovorum]|uniref:CdaR family protein n=1 Tax=Treponema pectinovorum TaxID=164 RepID=UPI0011CC5D30|nr:CdaR family protein [Treponema pectinovorum]
MKIREFINKATDNWPVKAACVLLALCLYIFYTLSMQEKRSFTVPLRIKSVSGIAPAGHYPSTVKITLKGKTEDIASIRENEISAYLSLDYLSKDGTYSIPVLVDLPQQALLLDTMEVMVYPKEVKLKVEEQISGFVNVKPLINGEVAYGYEIKKVTLKPETVEIYGPRSMVLNCNRVQTKGIFVKNAETTFETQVDIESPGAFLKLKDSQKIFATVEIAAIFSEKKFSNVSIGFSGLSDDFEVSPQSFADIQLAGSLAELEKFVPPYGTLYVDCSSIEKTGTYELPIIVSVPEKFTVKSLSKQKITVNVKRVSKTGEFEEKLNDEINPIIPESKPEKTENNSGDI